MNNDEQDGEQDGEKDGEKDDEQDDEQKLRQQLCDVLRPLIQDILNKYPLNKFPKTDIAKVIHAILKNGDGIAILEAIQKGDDALCEYLKTILGSKCLPTRVWRYTAYKGTISSATYIPLRKAMQMMKRTRTHCIMPRCIPVLHYPVDATDNGKQERNRYGTGLSYTFRHMGNYFGHLYRAILQAYVELKSLQGVRVHILIPVPDGVPDARNPDLSKENPAAVAHFATAIQMRVRFLRPVFGLCHWIVKSAPVWDEVMKDLNERHVNGGTVSMRSLRLRTRLANMMEGLDSAYSSFTIQIVKQNGTDMVIVKNKHPSNPFATSNERAFETIVSAAILKFPTSQVHFYKIVQPLVSLYIENYEESIGEILLGLKNERATVRRIVKEILNEYLVLSS